jgi:hypothetical protein
MQASGYRVPVSPLIVATAGLALILSPFGVYSICIAAITAAIAKVRRPILTRSDAGWPPPPRAVFICWPACSAVRLPR